ncbi:sulfotransferase, partial [Acidobacteria bacterium AH-259-G07]|nr:sulfotransferase [Acidobacteria bacterium AH-259-G07]
MWPQRWYSDRPPDFLIIGLQKCGTYWLTALLDSHPEITSFPNRPGGAAGVKEGHFFDTLGQIDTKRAWSTSVFTHKHDGFFMDLVPLIDQIERNELLDLFRRRYNAFVQRQRVKRLVGDKTPEYVFYLDLIDKLCPQVNKICILRDPRDRMVSLHFDQLRKLSISNEDIEDWEVREYTERIRTEFSILLGYTGNMWLLTYEALLQQTQRSTADLL